MEWYTEGEIDVSDLECKDQRARPEMTKRILDLPEPLGDVISNAVLSVTQDPDEYDLWYHNEPIWLVHRRRLAGDQVRVSRVQITPCLIDNQAVLLVQPDAQLLDKCEDHNGRPAREYAKKSLSIGTSASRADSIDLAKLFQEDSVGHLEWAKQTIAEMIRKAWDKAESVKDEELELSHGPARAY